MGVYRGVAVAREMLQTGYYSCCLIAFNCSGGKTGNLKRVFAKRANADHGVGRIVVDINDGGQVHIDAEGFEFAPRCLSYSVGQRLRADSSEGHISWKLRYGFSKALHHPVLMVDSNEQWMTMPGIFRASLQTFREFENLLRI